MRTTTASVFVLWLLSAIGCVQPPQQQPAAPTQVTQTVNNPSAQPIVVTEQPAVYVGPGYWYRGYRYYYWGGPYYGYYRCPPGPTCTVPVGPRGGPRVIVNAPFVHVDVPAKPKPAPKPHP